MKKWIVKNKFKVESSHSTSSGQAKLKVEEIVKILLENRGLIGFSDINNFLNPPDPYTLIPAAVGIDENQLNLVLDRLIRAIANKEKIIVYGDYDADGITAGTIMWETLYLLGADVLPYIPDRFSEGYGFSISAIEKIKKEHNPTLIITVDHGITAREKIEFAKNLGIDIIVTDLLVKPEKVPDCITVHTTQLCGAGISWFVAKELLLRGKGLGVRGKVINQSELLALAAIGTIADMVPLHGANRAIAKAGLAAVNKTTRVGLMALIKSSSLELGSIGVHDISHMLAPRLNAMGRLVHGLVALRLLCTSNEMKAAQLSQKLGLTNKQRQDITEQGVLHAKSLIENEKRQTNKKLLFVVHTEYNQGVIGLIAGKLVEAYYRPAIVVAAGEILSKASARSIAGFDMIAAIRNFSHLVVEAGGHPMAAGFTIKTDQITALQTELETYAAAQIPNELLLRTLHVDCELPFSYITETFWQKLQEFAPFGMGNPEPVFATFGAKVIDVFPMGKELKHLKLKLTDATKQIVEAVGFGMGSSYKEILANPFVNVAYAIDLNKWNGTRRMQLKLKDLQIIN